MRKNTLEAIEMCVYTLENNFINPHLFDLKEVPPMTIEDAIRYCYVEFVDIVKNLSGFSEEVFFDSKEIIKKEIEAQIRKNKHIIIKERHNDNHI